MLNLPGEVTSKYTLPENCTQDQLVEDLHNRIDFAVSFFKSIPHQKGWLNEDENQALVSKCISKFEGLALGGKLAAEDARKVYAAIVEGGFGSLFNTITCRFSKNSDLFFNKMLFNAISENSRKPNFIRMLEWGNGSLGFKDTDYQSIVNVSEWFRTGQLNLDKVDSKNLTKAIGELLLITTHQKIDEMSSQLLTFVMKKLSFEQKIDVALYVGSKDMLTTANLLLQDYCEGVGIRLGEGNICRLLVSDTEALKQLWETEKKGDIESLFQVFSKHGLNVMFKLDVNLAEADGEILEALFSSIGPSIQRFSVTLKPAEEKTFTFSVSGVIALLCDMQNLEYFHLESKDCLLSADHFLQIGAICPAVSSIAIDDCKNAHKEFINGLVERSGVKLTHLRINGCGDIDDSVAVAIGEYCPNIEVFFFDSGGVDGDSDISTDAVVKMFGDCEKLKTLQFYNSENAPAPPGDMNPYDLGVINELMETYNDRVIHINYNFRKYT